MTPLERKRLSLDLTQDALAKKIGVTAAAISAWETGTRTPSAGYYGPLSKALKITPDELMDLIAPTTTIGKGKQSVAAK